MDEIEYDKEFLTEWYRVHEALPGHMAAFDFGPVPKERVKRLCFGFYMKGKTIGMAEAIKMVEQSLL